MEHEGSSSVFAMMIDMYPIGAKSESSYRDGEPFMSAAGHFDLGPYDVSIRSRYAFPPIKVRGGFQHRLLRRHQTGSRGPLLKKLPFVRWQAGGFYGASAHSIEPATALSRVTAGLLHFKFLMAADVESRESFTASRRRSGENRRISYLSKIFQSSAPEDFRDENSIAYRDSIQLTELGFLHCNSDFAEFVEGLSGNGIEGVDGRSLRAVLSKPAKNPRGLAAILRQHVLGY